MTFSWRRAKNKGKSIIASPEADDAVTAVKRTLLVSLVLAEVAVSGLPIPGVAAAVLGVLELIRAIEVGYTSNRRTRSSKLAS